MEIPVFPTSRANRSRRVPGFVMAAVPFFVTSGVERLALVPVIMNWQERPWLQIRLACESKMHNDFIQLQIVSMGAMEAKRLCRQDTFLE